MGREAYASADAAEAYDRKRQRTFLRRLSVRREERLIRRLMGRTEGALLDAPCGAGRFPEAAVSLDLSGPMLALAQGKGRRCVRGDLAVLPFRDRSFGGVLCIRCLHHFDERLRRAFLAELRRVAPRAVVTYFGTRGLKARRRARRSRRTRRGVSCEAFAADCSAAGWRIARDQAVVPLWGEQRVALLVAE